MGQTRKGTISLANGERRASRDLSDTDAIAPLPRADWARSTLVSRRERAPVLVEQFLVEQFGFFQRVHSGSERCPL